MSANKPQALLTGNYKKKYLKDRMAAEEAMNPGFPMPSDIPVRLKGKKIAETTWKKMTALYESTSGKLVTAFDENLLVTLCLLEEELEWVNNLRGKVQNNIDRIEKVLSKKPDQKKEKDVFRSYQALVREYHYLISRMQGFDARIDGKRKLIHSISQSLYLTPRSRAGVVPKPKRPE